MLHATLPPHELARSLNAAVVGLCAAPPPGADPADPPPCLGLGLVRTADAAARQLHVVTPLEEEALLGVASLQLGRLELPATLLQTPARMSPYLALFGVAPGSAGAAAIRSRNNLLRQSQL